MSAASTPLPPNSPVAAPTAATSALNFVKRNKLRVFIGLSLGLHALIGVGWGVPAYVHEVRVRAEQEALAKKLLADQQAAAAKVDKANAKSLELARADVVKQLRATYDTLVNGLTTPQQEELWKGVVDSLHDPIDALAKAMGDSATTEQDLRNLQADLNRKLVENTHTQLAAKLGKWTQDDIVAQVQKKLVPLLDAHYHGELDTRAGKTLRESAGQYLKANAPKGSSPDAARQVLAQSRDVLTPYGESTFGDDFHQFASDRLAGVLVDQLTPALAGRNLQDAKYLAATRAVIAQAIHTGVVSVGRYGDSVTARLKEFGAADKSASPQATEFVYNIKASVGDKIAEVTKDGSADDQLIRRADIRLSDAQADAAYRVDTMAEHAQDGRTVTGLDGMAERSLTEMREDALARMSQISTMSQDGNDPSFMQGDDNATTQPAVDPMLQAAMDDVWKALHAEFDKMVAGKRTPDQANLIWNAVQPPMEPDVTTFAGSLLDPSLSKAQLETKRVQLNTRFAELVRAALEQNIKDDLGQKLVDQLKGDGGDQIVKAYKDPLKQTVGTQLTHALMNGAQQERRDTVKELAGVKAAVDKAAATAAQAEKSTDQAKKLLANTPTVKSAAGALATQQKSVDAATDQVKAATTQPDFKSPATAGKMEALKTAAAAASSDLKAAADAATKGDAATAQAAADKAKDSAAKLSAAAKDAQAAVSNEVDEAARQYAASAKAMTQTGSTPTTAPSIASGVDKEFEKQFHDQAMKPLVDEILKRFNDQLKKEGLAKDTDTTGLDKKIEQALSDKTKAPQAAGADAKQAGDANNGAAASSAGSVAMSGVDQKATADADGAASKPSEKAEAKIKAVADTIVKAGVGTAASGLRGQSAIAAAVAAAGTDQQAADLHKQLVDDEAAARAGHGDLMGEGSGDNSLDALRSKWLAATGAGKGDTANGNGDAGQGQAAAGAGNSNGAGNGSGAGSGQGSGRGSAHGGVGASLAMGPGGFRPQQGFDRKKLDDLANQSKDRGKVTGAGLDAKGASGDTSRVETDAEPVVAAVLRPSQPPQMQVKDGDPYQPKFKTIRFATIPFLNKAFTIDGNFDKWKDIPAVDLLPEKFDGTRMAGLRAEDKLSAKMAWDGTGLYFYVNVIDPNGKIDLTNSSSFWAGDVEEVWIDMLNTKERYRARGTGQQFWCWPFGSQQDASQTGGESIVERNSFHYYPMGPGGMQRAARKTADGYEVEFEIPAERLKDGELSAGKIVGMNLNVETGSQLQYYWASSKAVATYTRPDTWGDILLGGSDGTLEIPAKLTAEGSAAEAHETRNAFVIGEPLRLRVTDRDMNLNPNYRDKVAVTVRNPRGQQTIAILEETTPSSGIFEGAVRTGLEMGTPVPATLSVYDGESVTVTYIDQARANGGRNASVTYHVQAALPLTSGVAMK